jgi:hypothetical protein
MGSPRPFSKLKKTIEGLFDKKLKMQFCCIAYPMRAQYANNHTPRFYVKLGKEIIWDFPKDFSTEQVSLESFMYRSNNEICELVRDYIDTPVDKLIRKKFKRDTLECIMQNLWEPTQETITVNYKLTEIFIAADRRLGKEALLKWAAKKQNPIVDAILAKRYNIS